MSTHDQNDIANPLDPDNSLATNSKADATEKLVHPQQDLKDEDSAVTRAEKVERHGASAEFEESRAKRVKLGTEPEHQGSRQEVRQKGVAPIKPEFLIYPPGSRGDSHTTAANDDAAEGAAHKAPDDRDRSKKDKAKGQNTNRNFGSSRDEIGLCQSRANRPEFSPQECRFGVKCKFEHDLRKYLKDWKREDLSTFAGVCPTWSLKGRCDSGWKCRFAASHSEERTIEDGRKELVLLEKAPDSNSVEPVSTDGLLNEISTQGKIDLTKRKVKTPKADQFSQWIEKLGQLNDSHDGPQNESQPNGSNTVTEGKEKETTKHDNRARYVEPPFLPSEKRKIYFGPETPVLAPLTTQGNLAFRRLCISHGAQVTYSEMAMSIPLLQGQKSEWALMRAHPWEAVPPKYSGKYSVVEGYDNSKDSKFGAQIAASKPWQALKATEVLGKYCSQLRVIDLNCGCPIDLVYRAGAGSALLDRGSKLENIVRGMNAVSGEIPITVKIRMGTKDNRPTAEKLIGRLIYGGQTSHEHDLGSCGTAAITLHGRSRQQRYTRNADWGYISECAALIKRYHENEDEVADTARESDPRSQPNGGKVYFLGNGDCYSHTSYQDSLASSGVDAVMLARGALIKPWLFEEIEKGQYLDKSASERLGLVEQYVRYGLETWGSDEMGIGLTRRFLLEWLSFAYRYVPVGILEYLPPSLQDRPPAWKGRNELETLLGSGNYKDWIKISEMFLGPAHKDFKFEPKHKSNSYEIEAEG